MELKLIIVIGLGMILSDSVFSMPQHHNNQVTNKHEYYMGVKVYPIERECAMVGGLCVKKHNCDTLTSTSGLCKNNKHRGVECCYKVKEAKNELLTCEEQTGACMEFCNTSLQRKASNCGEQPCCILI